MRFFASRGSIQTKDAHKIWGLFKPLEERTINEKIGLSGNKSQISTFEIVSSAVKGNINLDEPFNLVAYQRIIDRNNRFLALKESKRVVPLESDVEKACFGDRLEEQHAEALIVLGSLSDECEGFNPVAVFLDALGGDEDAQLFLKELVVEGHPVGVFIVEHLRFVEQSR